MPVIAVVNQKGGVGKSTLSVLLLKAFVDNGHACLGIDVDPQAGLTSLLAPAFVPEEEVPSSADLIFSGGAAWAPLAVSVPGGKRTAKPSGRMDIVPSDERLDSVYASVDERAIRRLLTSARLLPYQYVVIDCPPTMQGITRAAVTAADIIVVPTDCSRQAFRPTQYTISKIREMEREPDLVFVGFKDPRDGSQGFQSRLMSDYRAAFGEMVRAAIPRTAQVAALATELEKTYSEAQRIEISRPLLALAGAA